ncbi:hypothetical protein FA15DRAFT_666419 [Coprinopsis marcescibilis]|uniref:Trafficking protein particle complex subunit 10 n=1 Tax=Coprinopsis marcescibilis TaxID=230819 RepID=A0A5C3L2X5_COPMA|nr:hypothetical protein FA15DRAFT_666419 [Coprinopsis marcescibilis]
MPTEHQVLVSYTGPKFFLGTQKWNIFHQSMVSQFPLQNVQWRSSSRNSNVKTIPSLDVKLVLLEYVRDELASQVPSTILEKPILHVYIAHCEDHDLDTYKALKKEIKEWTMLVSQKKNPEWLILQIVTPDPAKQPRTGLFGGSVLEKLKADFNLPDKRNRCAQISYSPNLENRLLWAEFHSSMKECLSYALDNAISQRQEDVRRSESQQQMPGWNFCTFFILKESLALSYEGINLFEDALAQYEELESSFLQVSKERNMSWFGALINPADGDDSAPLLSPSKKPYRELILANNISIFDLRVYILSRQCRLIAKAGQVDRVPRKVGAFLGSMSKSLAQVLETLPRFFIQSWVYSAATDTVEQLKTWMQKYPPKNGEKAVYAGIGELLDLARSQLDVIGIELGTLPDTPPFSMSLPNRSKGRSSSDSGAVTNKSLLDVLDHPENFYDLYVHHANEAIAMYAKSDRSRFGVKLYGCIAALDLHRGNLQRALQTYSSLASHYSPHTWVSMESYMFSRALDTHKKLEKPRDSEWIHLILSFLKAFVENSGAEALISSSNSNGYVSDFVHEVKEVAAGLDNDIRYADHPILSLEVARTATLAGDRDGSTLEVTVCNNLPCPFPADEILVILSGRDFERFQFTTTTESLPPGKSKVTLFCPNAASGTFFVDSSDVRATKLLLQYPQRKSTYSTNHQIVRVNPDPLALNVRVFQSRTVELGKPFSVSLRVWTGRNAIDTLELRLSAPSASFRFKDASLDDEDSEINLETDHNGIKLKDLPKDTTVRLSIPYSESISTQSMRVDTEVDYTTVDEPDLQRIMRFASNISPSLPISVRVQDWFRESRLISSFSVKSTTHQYIRVASARLVVPEGLKGIQVTPCNIRQGIITVTPNENANFLFALDSMDEAGGESLSFHIKYRLLREEVASIIEDQVRSVLEQSSKSQDIRPLVVEKLIELLERDANWVSLYNITGEIELPDPAKEDHELGEMLSKTIEQLKHHRHPKQPEGIWRELTLPVDVPVKSIVATASINIISTPFSASQGLDAPLSLYAGQPINAELVIRTSFRWGTEDDTSQKYVLNYQIEDMTREWLIGGVKQGDFIAEKDGQISIPLTLMALHHGEFGLPKVHVQARLSGRDVTMNSRAPPSVETYQQHRAVKVLVLPRGGRSTFVISMGADPDY